MPMSDSGDDASPRYYEPRTANNRDPDQDSSDNGKSGATWTTTLMTPTKYREKLANDPHHGTLHDHQYSNRRRRPKRSTNGLDSTQESYYQRGDDDHREHSDQSSERGSYQRGRQLHAVPIQRPTEKQTQATKAVPNLYPPVYHFGTCHRDLKYADLPNNEQSSTQYGQSGNPSWNGTYNVPQDSSSGGPTVFSSSNTQQQSGAGNNNRVPANPASSAGATRPPRGAERPHEYDDYERDDDYDDDSNRRRPGRQPNPSDGVLGLVQGPRINSRR